MKTIHVIQHTSGEYLGLIEDHLEGRGVRFRYARPFATKGGLPPAEALTDGLILLGGGPWGSTGVRDLPTLEREIELARACLVRDWPLIGIGLGAQIVALAAGSRAEPTPLEFSVTTATRVADSALEGYLPARYPIAIYMRDWPVPPDGAEVLACDPSDRPVLWQLGTKTLGFAGHPGLKVAMVEDLIMEFEDSPPDVEAALARLRASQPAIEDALVPIMTGVVRLTGWMDRAASQ